MGIGSIIWIEMKKEKKRTVNRNNEIERKQQWIKNWKEKKNGNSNDILVS